ncbi:MAG: formylglycine-generating enzyme family protein [Pseudomonadales bacterium]|nr:formylglycine-generating enzyme family protein [Pseudomonadales bacterium]
MIVNKLTVFLGLAGLAAMFAVSSLGLSGSRAGRSERVRLDCNDFPAGDPAHAGMVWVPGGRFRMGADYAYAEEGPVQQQEVSGFWMAQHEVSNRQFAAFVTATGYLTLAERGSEDANVPAAQRVPGAAVFVPLAQGRVPGPWENWWHFVPGANWRHPEGPDSKLLGREDHPVVQVAYEDALAYAAWAGHALPTEAQFEYAAQSSARKDDDGLFTANTWQGLFPFQNDSRDGFTGTAPVGCYPPNAYGLYDLIGNVWEWTASPYYDSHDFDEKDRYPQGFDPAQPDAAVAVIKGGSYLCAPNYCLRYRPQARQGQSIGLGTSHVGFRTVVTPRR